MHQHISIAEISKETITLKKRNNERIRKNRNDRNHRNNSRGKNVLLFKCDEEVTHQTRLKGFKENNLGVIGSKDRLKKEGKVKEEKDRGQRGVERRSAIPLPLPL